MSLVQLRTAPPDLSPPHPGDLAGALAVALGDPARVRTEPLELAAWAGDASVYRLVPRAIVRPRSEADVRALFAVSHAFGVPLTFRAAGTSLSGQAVTDGILVDLARDWSRVEPLDGGRRVRVQPGAIGGRVNAVLRRLGWRIGPDPASIDACMMGGILANNASGMCCGVAENAYHTLASIRFVLPGGHVVDTAAPDADAQLARGEPGIHRGLLALRDEIRADPALVERIRAAFRIKNTTGYGLNAFLDFDEPAQILAHLLVGSEGTLAFISEAVLHTLPCLPWLRTGLLLFPSAAAAFDVVEPLARSGARAIEFMDDACLRALAGEAALGVDVASLPQGAAALLVEYQASTEAELVALRGGELQALAALRPLAPPRFTEDPAARAALWKLRKGLFPAAGATRRSGETVIIEDVAFPLPALPAATAALRALFVEHGYERALLFGHAKDGNCHFVITPSFSGPDDVARYERFLGAVAALVLRFGGSLKAEHGTGRNMAPFVEAAWGAEAYRIMRALKDLVDPTGLLNPDVILSRDPAVHVRHLKALPPVEQEVDRCIECGFCEPVCPSRRLTLTPRQRIAVRREVARLDAAGDVQGRAALEHAFAYQGVDTCAADGMCATACPVHIDTGQLVKRLRGARSGSRTHRLARRVASHFGLVERLLRLGVRLGHLAERLLGAARLGALAAAAERLLGTQVPKWSAALPLVPKQVAGHGDLGQAEAVYVPTCMSRVLGRPRGERLGVDELVLLLAERAGVPVAVPDDVGGSCCGLAFGSKGYRDAQLDLLGGLVESMWRWSGAGRVPLVLEATSCLHGILTSASSLPPDLAKKLAALRLVDVAAFTRDVLLPRLQVRPLDRRVILHPTCASRKLDGGAALQAVAARCATEVEVPVHLGCCAMAGDRGLLHPALNETAVAPERAEVEEGGPWEGAYANNLTCEIGMTQATGRQYLSFLYLVEEATRPAP